MNVKNWAIGNWVKDVLIICVSLSVLVSIVAYLLATDRVREPATFGNSSAIVTAANRVDAAVELVIDSQDVQKANRADSLKIARRLALALCGSLPSLEEIRELQRVDPDQQVDWYVSHLLEDRRTGDYLAERFARAFVGVETGPFLVYRRSRFVSWLSDQLVANARYDQIVEEMLNGSGTWTDSPAVNFYTGHIIPDVGDETRPDPIKLAARTSRAFLGMRIDCLQCHDDFIGTINLGDSQNPVGGTQLHFHQLASFFSQVQNSITGIGDNLESNEYRYRLLDSDQENPIDAIVPFHAELVDESLASHRKRLTSWLTHAENRPFARAAVNRIWAIMFGRGLINPVDDIPLEGPFPEAMEVLVDEFVESEFDLHFMIRLIAHTEAFQRDSTSDFEITDANKNTWAIFPMTRLRPEQVAGAITQSTSLKTIDSTSHIIERLMKFGETNDFVDRFGDPGEDEFNERNETISQRLLMLNGEVIRNRLSNGLNSPKRIAGLSPNMEIAVRTVYLVALCREPNAEELEHFRDQLEAMETKNEKDAKIEDLYWALMNSTEFRWNH